MFINNHRMFEKNHNITPYVLKIIQHAKVTYIPMLAADVLHWSGHLLCHHDNFSERCTYWFEAWRFYYIHACISPILCNDLLG